MDRVGRPNQFDPDVNVTSYPHPSPITTRSAPPNIATSMDPQPAYHGDEEKLLLAKIAEGDESAFATVFYRYVPLVRSVVMRVTRAEEAVPDLAQEIFLQVWLVREKLPELQSFRSWLLRILYNRSLDWLQRKKVRVSSVAEFGGEGETPYARGAAHDHADAHDPAALRQTLQWVVKAIDRLPSQAYKVYQLDWEHGLSISDIAAQMNISPQTVKNTISRAVASIREYLHSKGWSCLWCW